MDLTMKTSVFIVKATTEETDRWKFLHIYDNPVYFDLPPWTVSSNSSIDFSLAGLGLINWRSNYKTKSVSY